MFTFIVIVFMAFIITFLSTSFLIPRLKRSGITGKDINKPDAPEIPEMGGIAIVAGFSAALLLAIFFNTFNGFTFNIIYLLAAIITIHAVSFIGVVDDLINMPQWLKALLPLFAAVPLVAVKAAVSTQLAIPFFGAIDFGIIYIIILIPLAIAVCSNLTNMLAGFNGMESGMGIVIFAVMSILSFVHGRIEALVISLAMFGSLLAFLFFNRYPAKIFPGDVGNLTIGAALAAVVVVGNLETAGVILILPYSIDFFIKAYNRFPSSKWWGEFKDGKLYPVDEKIRGFAQFIMKRMGGVSETKLVLIFVAIELLFGLISLFLFLKF